MYLPPLHTHHQHPPSERNLCHSHSFLRVSLETIRATWFSFTTNLTLTLQYFFTGLQRQRPVRFSFSWYSQFQAQTKALKKDVSNRWMNKWNTKFNCRLWQTKNAASLSAKPINDLGRFWMLDAWHVWAHFGFTRTKRAGTTINPKGGCDTCL